MKGTGIFLIHGITKSNEELELIKFYLNSKGIEVEIPLLPGHGTCPCDNSTCLKHFWQTTEKDWLSYAEKEFNHFRKKFKRIYVGGVSFGGNIAISLASKYKVSGIILIGTPIFLSRVLSLTYKTGNITLKFMNKKNNRRSSKNRNKKQYHGLPVESLIKMTEFINKTRKKLSRINKPIIIFHSKKDDISHPKSARYIYKKVKSRKKELFWFDTERHGIDINSKKDSKLIANKIIEFIKQTENQKIAK